MKCPAPETLFEFAQGEASLAVERHVAECAACRAAVTEHRAMWSALDAWEAPAISPDFNRRLYARIEADKRRSARWFQPAMAAAAALVIVAGTAWMVERPAPAPAEPQMKSVSVEIEDTLDDLEMLRQLEAVKSKSREM